MTEAVTIRRATVADLAQVQALRLDLFTAVGDVQSDAERAAFAAALDNYLPTELAAERFLAWLACGPAGEVVGCGGLVFVQKPPAALNPTGREAYLMNMYTAPAWRGQGIAGRILTEILAAVQAAGVTLVRLHATAAGRPIYERRGFRPVDDEMVLHLAVHEGG